MELEELKEKISKEASIPKDELEQRIEDKIIELSGLVSEEGAAYIIAKEEGLDLLEKRDLSLKIKNVVPGLKSVDVVGKIVSLSEVREFSKADRKGKVQNVVIGDETGTIRVVFWNEKVKEAEALKPGDVIRVNRCITKPNSFGIPEIHTGQSSIIQKVDRDIKVAENSKPFGEGYSGGQISAKRRQLDELRENDFAETRAIIVSTTENEYLTCPKCEGRVEDSDGDYRCEKDGKVEPKRNLIVKGYLDDGTSAKRFVSFRDVAQKIKKDKLVGKEMLFVGKVRKNEFFGDSELILNDIRLVNFEEEVEKLL
ncbi:MAG: hypothetical protein JW727_03680 [Candidatus Aenigmarchaeota archaeon]|nr:hypothetical protein [Candidatus Aenigmarchaeota archaeon]